MRVKLLHSAVPAKPRPRRPRLPVIMVGSLDEALLKRKEAADARAVELGRREAVLAEKEAVLAEQEAEQEAVFAEQEAVLAEKEAVLAEAVLASREALQLRQMRTAISRRTSMDDRPKAVGLIDSARVRTTPTGGICSRTTQLLAQMQVTMAITASRPEKLCAGTSAAGGSSSRMTEARISSATSRSSRTAMHSWRARRCSSSRSSTIARASTWRQR